MDKRDLTYQSHQVQPKNESHLAPKVSGQRKAGAVDMRSAHDSDQHGSRGEQLVSRMYTLGDNDLA